MNCIKAGCVARNNAARSFPVLLDVRVLPSRSRWRALGLVSGCRVTRPFLIDRVVDRLLSGMRA